MVGKLNDYYYYYYFFFFGGAVSYMCLDRGVHFYLFTFHFQDVVFLHNHTKDFITRKLH